MPCNDGAPREGLTPTSTSIARTIYNVLFRVRSLYYLAESLPTPRSTEKGQEDAPNYIASEFRAQQLGFWVCAPKLYTRRPPCPD